MNDRENEIKENIGRIREEIAKAAESCGRKPEDITLLAVSKTYPTEDILFATKTGQLDFGENRPQELMRKIEEISPEKKIRWHLIGQLQKNKVKYIMEKNVLVHSLCEESTLNEMERLGNIRDCKIDALIEVNTSGELSKSGVSVEETGAFIEKVLNCPHINLKGFMTIAKYGTDEYEARTYFATLKELSEKYESYFSQKPVLSMGMSGDFVSAIKEGSDIVRIGTAIFGKRIYSN